MRHLSNLLRIALAVALVSLSAPAIRDGFAATVRVVANQLAPGVHQGDRNGLNP